MNQWAGDLKENLRKVCESLPEIRIPWSETHLVDRRDAKVRSKEGLVVEASQVLQGSSGDRWVSVTSALSGQSPWKLEADLLNGQKTGFFLDQSHNMRLLIAAMERRERFKAANSAVRVLDLCSYVGHWSLQVGQALRVWESPVECHLVDVSAAALQRAQGNLKAADLKSEIYEVDVMKETASLPEGPFDVVIVDPPAFAKAQRDVEVAKAAYEKLNLEAFRRTRTGALVVSCSCSGLVSREEFLESVGKALRKSGRQGRVIALGQAGEDHPMLPWFPEGSYLKMVLTEIL
jgi:23S rRNA (cytosine1962-C5)-methyltransferase